MLLLDDLDDTGSLRFVSANPAASRFVGLLLEDVTERRAEEGRRLAAAQGVFDPGPGAFEGITLTENGADPAAA